MLTLNSNISYIKGKYRAVIYDTCSENLYHLSRNANLFLEQILSNPSEKKTKYEKSSLFQSLWNLNIITDSLNPLSYHAKKKSPQIKFAWIELTTGCNLKCIHCYDSASHNQNFMSYDNYKYVVDELRHNNIKSVQIIGGEPFIIGKKLENFFTYLLESDFSFIEVFTNGTFINEQWAKFFRDTNIRVALSVYSYNPKEHDYVTKVPGSFLKTANAIKLLKKYSVKYRVANILINNVSLGKKNTDLFDLNPRRDVVRMTGRASFDLLNPDLIKLRLITKETFRKKISKSFYYSALYSHNCFSNKILISPDLNVYPCVMERRFCHGNLKERNLKLLLSDSIMNYNKDKINVCKDCEFRYHCFDCRPNSLEMDINSKPWYCTYNPYVGQWADIDNFIENLNKLYKINFVKK